MRKYLDNIRNKFLDYRRILKIAPPKKGVSLKGIVEIMNSSLPDSYKELREFARTMRLMSESR